MAGVHLTDVPTHMTYSSVVSRDTLRIGFLVDALNGLDIPAGYIHNSFLESPTQENIFFYACNECKSDKDRVGVVIPALYGLKYSALQFRNHIAETLGNKLCFVSSLTDSDLCYKSSTSSDLFEYYLYILVYIYDLIIM